MSKPVIKVENLSKQYRIGEHETYKTFREAIVRAVRSPFYRMMGAFGNSRNNDSVLSAPRSTPLALNPEPSPDSDTIWALKDVSFEVKQGEVIGIIGKNGVGKSTLLKILSKITEPTSGRVELKGRVGSLLEVGTGFHPELTGHENIYLYGAILGMDRWEVTRKFDEIVAFAEIEKFIDTPVKRYSSGMYMRLAFAVAAHLEPEILLVDEVLAVGDIAFQKKCLGKMGNVAEEGRTVLFVSHNMVAIQKLCKRTIRLHDGTITENGDSSQVVANYLKTSHSPVTEQIWKDKRLAPGNDEVRIRRIFIRPVSDDAESVLTTDKIIEIGVEFYPIIPNQNLAITFHILTPEGVLAFTTSTVHNALLQEKRLDCDLYRACCQIPANLLNSARYILRLFVVKDQSHVIFDMEEALAFDVFETRERQWAYTGKRPGIFAPLLSWDLKKCDKYDSSRIRICEKEVSSTKDKSKIW